MGGFTELFDIFILLSGVYLLYSAVTGKGSLYKTDSVKEGKEKEYRRFVRLFCIFGGAIAVGQGALDYFRIEPYATVLFFLLCVAIVAFAVVNGRYQAGRGKEKKQK